MTDPLAHGAHAHGPHAHGPHGASGTRDRRRLVIGLSLILAFMIGEIVVAAVANSLALFADAGHMLTDAGALAAALWAARLAVRPAAGVWTYGLKRAEILSAAGNGATLILISVIIAIEAIRRLASPASVDGGAVLVVALVGVAVNLVVVFVLAGASRDSLNVRGAFLHILTDMYAFIATAVAGIVVMTTGWHRADVVASLVVVALMLHAAWFLLRDAGRILLQAAPADIDLAAVRAELLLDDHVIDVHDLHVWTLTSQQPTLSAHVVVQDHCFASGHAPQLLDALQRRIAGRFDVTHATFQLEPESHVAHEADVHV